MDNNDGQHPFTKGNRDAEEGFISGVIWWLLVSMALFIAVLISLILPPKVKGNPTCYRPPVAYYPPVHLQAPYVPPPPPYPYSPPYYIQKELVPYVVEIQVYKDRYYSLSDLYRDRLYIQMFDAYKNLQGQQVAMNGQGYGSPLPGDGMTTNVPQTPTPTVNVPQPSSQSAAVLPKGKANPVALTILKDNCFACHGKDNKHLDLTNPDLVPVTKRWAAFGMMASRDMPKPPGKLEGKELQDWMKEHGLKDEEIQKVYDGWVKLK